MIKHIVMFKFREQAEGRTAVENAQIAAEMLSALQGVVPTLKASRVSLNSEKATPANYELVLETEFDDMEGLAAYAVHPEHVKVGTFIRSVMVSRACVDYEF
ncbi:MAG: Dabb family protein [Ruminococcaceae bacterium]|nr:Dabb family protein [Oscillospiraceae bacterium]